MRRTIQTIKNRPSTFVIIAVLSAVFCGAFQFNSFARKFGTIGSIFGTDYVELLTNIAAWAKGKAEDPRLMAVAILVIILMILAISAIFAFIYSGFSYLMYVQAFSNIHESDKKPKKSNELFKEGINKRFSKMFGFFIGFFATAILILISFFYCLMPMFMSIKKVINGDASSMLSMIVITLITIIILFFVSMFYAMYVSFMMPSMIAFKKGALRVAFKLVNSYCWYLIPRTLGYILYNAVLYIIMLAISYGTAEGGMAVVVFLINWILVTLGNVVYTYYVFHTYIEMKDDLFSDD